VCISGVESPEGSGLPEWADHLPDLKHGLVQDYLIQQLKNPTVQMVLA